MYFLKFKYLNYSFESMPELHTILHRGDSLVLMDAGCEYYGYASDITRTWPVNGSFKPVQRDLYEIILRIKNTCIDVSI